MKTDRSIRSTATALIVIYYILTVVAVAALFVLPKYVVIIALVLAALLLTYTYVIIINRVAKPLQELNQVTEGALHGEVTDVADTVSSIYSRNEIGYLSNSIVHLVEYLERYASTTAALANRDLSMEFELASDTDLVGQSLNAMLLENNKALSSIHDAAELISQEARDMLQSGLSLAKTATEQASAIEEITAAISQISIQAKQNSKNGEYALQLSSEAAGIIDIGNTKIGELKLEMEAISKAADDIYKITNLIDTLAFQTNLLALNASIEAAKSDQNGKGFAVVANEVKTLAHRSAAAAQETHQLIQESFAKVSSGMKMTEEAAEALRKTYDAARKHSELMESIAEATNEQTAGIEQIRISISQIARAAEANATFTEKSASASQHLIQQAEAMYDLTNKYKLSQKYTSKHPGNASSASKEPSYEAASRLAKPTDEIEIMLNSDDYGKY